MSSSRAGSCLALFLLSSILSAQPPNGTISQTQAHTKTAASSAKRTKPLTASSVEIINGTVETNVTFKPQRPPIVGSHQSVHPTPPKRAARKQVKDASSVDQVEIINGTRVETKVFTGEAQTRILSNAPPNNQPVVIGVASSETGQSRNMQPVVVGIASAGSVSAGKTVRRAPIPRRSKRPPYTPSTSDAH